MLLMRIYTYCNDAAMAENMLASLLGITLREWLSFECN